MSTHHGGNKVSLNLNVPESLKAAVAAYGKATGVSQNAAAILLLRRGLGVDPMPVPDPARQEALDAGARVRLGILCGVKHPKATPDSAGCTEPAGHRGDHVYGGTL